jgi:hypothetical protein
MVDKSSPGTSDIASVSDARRRSGERQPPALDRREVLPDAVDFADAGAAGEQGFGHRALLLQRDAGHRRRQQGRTAAGQQHQHQVVRRQAL